jgi:transcriptional regulator with XRE-family HTH domain
MSAQNNLLTVDQVATKLNVSPRTVRNLIKRGRFPNAKKMDPLAEKSTYQIPETDVHNYQNLQKSTF